MTNLDLENYIKSSRASGLTDDQIKQTLSTQGWSQADISEAMGASVSAGTVSAVGTTAVVGAASAWSAKTIVAIIVGLAILGTGGYFVFAKKSSQNMNDSLDSNQAASNIPKTSKSDNTPFTCKELLSDAEFETATGKKAADYTLEEKHDNVLGCVYNSIGDVKNLDVISFGLSSPSPLTASSMVEALAPKKPDPLTAESLGMTPAELANFKAPEKITDVGLFAYDMGFLEIASSNDKYVIMVGSLAGFFSSLSNHDTATSISAKELQKRIGRIVDSHLK